jgi:membrane protease YdiL (CAAX protease family)
MRDFQLTRPLPATHLETAFVAAILIVSILDDLLLGTHITEINEYVLADYAKKSLIIVLCLSTAPARAIVRRSISAPDLPWSGSGWLNGHVLALVAGTILCDRLLHGLGEFFSSWQEAPAVADIPAYRDDIVKYFDLTFGLMLNSVSEEVFYRAVLIAVVFRYVPSVGASILIAGLLFGAAHWSQGIVWTAVISMSGVMYGYLYCLTRSIVPLIIAHYIHNLIVFTP